MTVQERKERSRAATRRWRIRNPERVRASTKAWREARPERVKEYHARYAERRAQWSRANRPRKRAAYKKWYDKSWGDYKPNRRDRELRQRYGITLVEYEKMLEAQGGVCAICQQPPSGKRPLAVDHCHRQNKMRALLCDLCNKALGSFRDDPDIMLRALQYLVRFQEGK